MRLNNRLVLASAMALCTMTASADSFIYVVTFGQQFGTVDVNNGVFKAIGPGLPDVSAALIPGAAGGLLSLTGSGNLVSINPFTGISSIVGSTGLGNQANAFGTFGGALYVTDLQNNLYKLNPTTGLATLIGSTGIPADPSQPDTANPDGSFNLTDENLFSKDGKFYATFDAFAIGTDGYTTTVQVPPSLWQLDPSTGAATRLSSLPLHLITTFDLDSSLYAVQGFPTAAHPFPSPEIDLSAFDVSNGTTSVVRSVDSSAGPILGATPVVPEPGSLWLLGTGLLALGARLRGRTSVKRAL